ncbi:MAG: chalcone isomerase family protein [Bdellovibrio sp.]
MNFFARATAFAFLSVALSTSMAYASLLKMEKGTRSIEGVNVSKSAEATVNGKSAELGTIGAGLRWKKILLSKVKVYVAQVLLSSPDRFVKKDKDALKSLDDSEIVAIQLTFLRTVDAATVQTSFHEALSVNKIDMTNESLKKFLAVVDQGGDATSGNSLTILIQKHSDGSESLIYEDCNGKQSQVDGDKGFTQKIMSIWLGTPADAGVASLKSDILS